VVEVSDFRLSIQKFCGRVTSKRTVNCEQIMYLCTPVIMRIQNMSYVGRPCKGAEFIGNKLTRSHTDIQLFNTGRK